MLVKKIPCILRNPAVYYHVHKSTPLVRVLSQLNPVHAHPSHPSNISFIITILSRPKSFVSFFLVSPPKPDIFLFSLCLFLSCMPHVPSLSFPHISSTISSSNCGHARYVTVSTLLLLHISQVQISSSVACSNVLLACVGPVLSGTKFQTHRKQQ